MSLVSLARRLSLPLLAAFSLCGAAQASVVVASSGPSAGKYPVGKKLSAADVIKLENGDKITLLDDRGTRVLQGAGVYSASKSRGASRSTTFAALTRQRASTQVRTGAVRDVTFGPVRSPNLWYVNLAESGPVCIVDPATVSVWRPEYEKPESYAITSQSGGASETVSFQKSDMILPWDAAKLPISDGASYTVANRTNGQSRNIRFVVLENEPKGAEEAAEMLLQEGCKAQLDLLTDSLVLPAES